MKSSTEEKNPQLFLLVLRVRMARGTTQRDARLLFRRLGRAIRLHYLVMTHSQGWCVLTPRVLGYIREQRHAVVNWLLDQALVDKIDVFHPRTIEELMSGSVTWQSKETWDPYRPDTPAADEVPALLRTLALYSLERMVLSANR